MIGFFVLPIPQSILVVDDDVEIAALFKHTLQREGFEVVSFTNPLMAFEHLKTNSNKYSLIMTDLRMPNLNGLEFAKKIRIELDNNIVRIFLLTAFDVSDLASHKNYETAKIEQVIQKPIRLSLLKEILDKCLNIC